MLVPRLLLAGALLLPLTACTGSTAGPVAGAATPSPSAAAPGATAPGVPPSAAARLAAVPAPGTVERLAGPFDDRFTLTGTVLRSGTVRTALTVTSDVSELIVLEAQADFYDAAGLLLGSSRVTHEDSHSDGAEHAAGEAVALELVASPAYAARVSSAVLSVPVLVNE